MTGGDYLAAAKQAADDSLTAGGIDRSLLAVANTHALIAIAEGLRAVVGAVAGIPTYDTDEDPAEVAG